ncbi:hypothetical protein [Paenibacillus methanolicus]|uniref:Uncharacterized protein n=1 Tax=Paenibacillus methanolicus TaxID=582686 RepID=A0A5S5CES2_9BACL|nr:hypothetical protein [Paenibacillus methanolicus]TYP76796.1 hypothetical protein BCM02_103460 [Paenibacillus methanolicus]
MDSVKKIVYSKKIEKHVTYAPTLGSAIQYTNVGMLEEWIQCYLLLTRKAAPTLDALTKDEYLYFGVVKFPLRLIQPNGVDSGGSLSNGTAEHLADSPPMLVRYEEGKFHCIEQLDLLAELKQRKVNTFPTIIVMKRNDDYKRFMKYYGTIFHYVDHV